MLPSDEQFRLDTKKAIAKKIIEYLNEKENDTITLDLGELGGLMVELEAEALVKLKEEGLIGGDVTPKKMEIKGWSREDSKLYIASNPDYYTPEGEEELNELERQAEPENDWLVVHINRSDIRIKALKEKYGDGKGKIRNNDFIIAPALPSDADWQDVTIKFLNGEDVEIRYKSKFWCKTTYKKMGFVKSNSPLWKLLIQLSLKKSVIVRDGLSIKQKEGEIAMGGLSIKQKESKQKNKQLVSERLINYFWINDAPIKEVKGGYQTVFALEPEPTLRHEELWPGKKKGQYFESSDENKGDTESFAEDENMD